MSKVNTGARRSAAQSVRGVAVCIALLLAAGCDKEPTRARDAVLRLHVPAVKKAVQEDLAHQRSGLVEAAERLAPGFLVEDPAKREEQLRFALRYLQEPPRGVPELIVSPMSFLAAVDAEGRVIARDLKNPKEDRMRGLAVGERFAAVKRALTSGEPAADLVTFSEEAAAEKSYTRIQVQPVLHEGKVVGAVMAGIPLWRWAQRLSRQGQMELTAEKQAVYWVFAYHGERNFPPQQGIDLEAAMPLAPARRAALEASPGGYLGQVNQFGRWYVWGVLPTPSIGEDTGFVIVRAEPFE